MSYTYVKKITTALGWLRRLDALDPQTGEMVPVSAQPLMRIVGAATEGFMEVGETSDYIRLVGDFLATVQNADGSVAEYVSRTLIMPSVVDDVVLLMDRSKKETTVKGRTEDYYSVDKFYHTVEFVADISLVQPETPTRLGYVLSVQFSKYPSIATPLLRVAHDLTAWPVSTVELTSDPAAEATPASIAAKGKGKKKAA